MSVVEAIWAAGAAGVKLSVADGDLVLAAETAPSADLLALLAGYKSDLIGLVVPTPDPSRPPPDGQGPSALAEVQRRLLDDRDAVLQGLRGRKGGEGQMASFLAAAGVPIDWAEGFSRVAAREPPIGLSANDWIEVLHFGARFLVQGWAREAQAYGWTDDEMFGFSQNWASEQLFGVAFSFQADGETEACMVCSRGITVGHRSGGDMVDRESKRWALPAWGGHLDGYQSAFN